MIAFAALGLMLRTATPGAADVAGKFALVRALALGARAHDIAAGSRGVQVYSFPGAAD
jgi:hypothetical protein